jgi:hypothetical protein
MLDRRAQLMALQNMRRGSMGQPVQQGPAQSNMAGAFGGLPGAPQPGAVPPAQTNQRSAADAWGAYAQPAPTGNTNQLAQANWNQAMAQPAPQPPPPGPGGAFAGVMGPPPPQQNGGGMGQYMGGVMGPPQQGGMPAQRGPQRRRPMGGGY